MKNLLIALIALFTFASCDKSEQVKEVLVGNTYDGNVQNAVGGTIVQVFFEVEFMSDRDASLRVINSDGTLMREDFFSYSISKVDREYYSINIEDPVDNVVALTYSRKFERITMNWTEAGENYAIQMGRQ